MCKAVCARTPRLAIRPTKSVRTARRGQQGGFVSQKIITARKLQLSQSAAAHEVVQAQQVYHAQRLRVLSDVRAGYYELLVARRAIELQKQMVEIGRAGLKTAEDLLKAKEVSRIDTLQAKVELESASLELTSAQNRYDAAARQLAAVIGCGDADLTGVVEPAEWSVPLWTWPETFAGCAMRALNWPRLSPAYNVRVGNCSVRTPDAYPTSTPRPA